MNIKSPSETMSNAKLLNRAYLALTKATFSRDFDFKQALIENQKLITKLITVKNAQR
ncbi:MAG: hypothetical protein LBD41_05335 [Clostridiales Family XIII bacterium]|nr:hypothetical protein [Clostridiales Family XIII bacterium]